MRPGMIGEFLSHKYNYKPEKYGDEMIQTVFDVSFKFDSFGTVHRKLTKNIAISEESWLGLGLASPNQKEWYSLSSNPSVENSEGRYSAIYIELD